MRGRLKHFRPNCKPDRQLTAQPSLSPICRLSGDVTWFSPSSHTLDRPTSSLRKPNYLILPSRAKVGYARLPTYLLPHPKFIFPCLIPRVYSFCPLLCIFKVHVQVVWEKALYRWPVVVVGVKGQVWLWLWHGFEFISSNNL